MYNPTFIGDIDLNEDTLAHYGVKGMRWRHRKGQLKGKALELQAKLNRKRRGIKDPNTITVNAKKGDITTVDQLNGKYGPNGKNTGTMSYKKGVQAGRKRTGYRQYSGGEQWNPKTKDERTSKSIHNYNQAPESQRTNKFNGNTWVDEAMKYRGEGVLIESKKKKK